MEHPPDPRSLSLCSIPQPGLTKVRLLEEPVAVALAYGASGDEEELVCVFDLGGGTLDVALLEAGGGTIEVLATAGREPLHSALTLPSSPR